MHQQIFSWHLIQVLEIIDIASSEVLLASPTLMSGELKTTPNTLFVGGIANALTTTNVPTVYWDDGLALLDEVLILQKSPCDVTPRETE